MTLSQPKHNFIFASILTGIYDVNRNETLPEDDFGRVKEWYDALLKLNLRGVLFHNTFSEKTVKKYQNDLISFENVSFDTQFNPNVFRYLVYQAYLNQHFEHIENVFVTDVSDVVAVQNPFVQPLFLNHPNALFCGDELEILDNEWMQNHSTHLRNSIAGFEEYEEKNKNKTLLNCGIIGGNIQTMRDLMNDLAHVHRTYTRQNKTPFTLDMGAFNYIARTKFEAHLIHGAPVNTQFKKYESERIDCWFRHK